MIVNAQAGDILFFYFVVTVHILMIEIVTNPMAKMI
jgi:hypothetical protein